MQEPRTPEVLDALSLLSDELRRRIHSFIRDEGRPVSREEVGRGVGISAKLAAFHLEKLTERGLLSAHYARPPERSGPGAGRSAKYYEPSGLELQVSVPSRHYDLAGEMLVEALKSRGPSETAHDAVGRVARDKGTALGRDVRSDLKRGRLGPERALAIAEQLLRDYGYEPYRASAHEIRMRNCPFHRLARQDSDLVCGMNHAFIDGFTAGLGSESVAVDLEPAPGECCVTLRPEKRP